jgi:hypothetical protein
MPSTDGVRSSHTINLSDFQRLARAKEASDSQVRIGDDGTIKARSAFASRVVNLFSRSATVEARNKAVAEAFVQSVEQYVQAKGGGTAAEVQWTTSLVSELRASLANQLAGKAQLTLSDIKQQLGALKDPLGITSFVSQAESATSALKAGFDAYSAADASGNSVETLVGKFSDGGKLDRQELLRVGQWLKATTGAQDRVLQLIDNASVDALNSRIDSRVSQQREAGAIQEADAWQGVRDLVGQWRVDAGDLESMVSELTHYAQHIVKHQGDFSTTMDAQKGVRWKTENPGHEPPPADAQPKKSILKRTVAKIEVDPNPKWQDKGGAELPSNAPVPEQLASEAPVDPSLGSPQERIAKANLRDQGISGATHEHTRLRFNDDTPKT